MRRENYSENLELVANQHIQERNFWMNQLAGDLSKVTFPYDYQRRDREGSLLKQITFKFPGEISLRVMKLSDKVDHALYTILVTGLVILLNKYTGGNDITVGAPIYKQHTHKEFVNTVLALRNQLQETVSFKDLLLQVSQTIIEATDHFNYPMEILLEQLNFSFDKDEDFPLFDVIILLENLHDKSYINHIHVNMIFHFSKIDGKMEGTVWYNSALYDQRTIDRIISHFIRLWEKVLFNVDLEVSGIDILTEEEKRKLLFDFNNADITDVEYMSKKNLHQLFEKQVERTPHRIALVFEDQQLTYMQLNARSNQLARILRDKGIGPNIIVGLIIERSLEMMVSILGILKSGGAYLPIEPEHPENRVTSMLNDVNVPVLISKRDVIKKYSFISLKDISSVKQEPRLTSPRPQIKDLDQLPLPDRSLVDYERYNQYIGLAAVKDSMTLQGTRGCPFKCIYCHKIWPKSHMVRSAENIFSEVRRLYDIGVKRFSFIDDIFNLNVKNSTRFFELLIKNDLDLQLFFPNGMRGELLTREYMDLMIEAGMVNISLSLETASPRLQRLIKKNLNIEKLRENVQYLCQVYPQVILDIQTMHGFPTETEEEAMMTMDFLKTMKWIHFPYIHIVKIYQNTEMEKVALAHGMSKEVINRAANQAYHELSDTLPFDKNFTLKYQSEFLDEYFLARERLLHVLPYQMKVLTEDEIVQKYNSYLGERIDSFPGLLRFVGITGDELDADGFLPSDYMSVPHLDEKLKALFPGSEPAMDALRVLILDLSTFFSRKRDVFFNMVEAPLGPIYVLTYLNRHLGSRIKGKIAQSRFDFDSYEELKILLDEFKPDVIGIRTLTYYKNFFHEAVEVIRQYGIDVPIITGGPYATSDYQSLLQDGHIDLVVLGEGEITFCEVLEKIIENNGKLPDETILNQIPGIAFLPKKVHPSKRLVREIVCWEELNAELSKKSPENLPPRNRFSDPVYTIFTSGSTGKPKGTLNSHGNVYRVVRHTNYIDLNENDRVLQLSNYAFDGSVFDIYGALLNGAALVMMKPENVFSADTLSDLIDKEKITLFFLTTALFNILVEIGVNCLKNVRKVLFGGEKVSLEYSKQALEYLGKNRILHMYGPTETTVYATYYPIEWLAEKLGTVPIGKPISNTKVYILDKNQRFVPIGGYGEIYIGGEGVVRGYLNNPELTHRKFVANPFAKRERLYKTGDLARWLHDGNIEFIDRVDNQVKLRGYRIELGEIESRLLKHDKIKEVVVLVRELEAVEEDSGGEGDKNLCAYVVAQGELDPLELKEYLSEELPDYMIPPYFIPVEEIPLTPNGKIDRKKLPSIVMSEGEKYVAPENEIEKKLVEIWSAALGIEKSMIGVYSNFFELGGHSLKAAEVAANIHKELNIKLPLAELFRTPEIKGLAQYIEKNSTGGKERQFTSIVPAPKKAYYELSPAQKRLYILQQKNEKAVIGYNMAAVMDLEGNVDRMKFQEAFIKLIQRHESLRTCFEMVNGVPMQRIHETVTFKIDYYENGKVEVVIENFIRPFDLSKAPLLRVGLMKLNQEQYKLMVDLHHTIYDGISVQILVKDFIDIYMGRELPPLKLQYKDYSEWLNSGEKQKAIKQQEAFWLKQFEGKIPILNLPTDYPRPELQGIEGRQMDFDMGKEETEALKKMAASEKATLYMVLLVLYNVFLSKVCNQQDIIVGTVSAGRNYVDLEQIIGMFVNTLALRNYPKGEKSFKFFLKEVIASTVTAFDNQDYQFEDLVEKVVKKRDNSRNPLFDVRFTMNTIPPSTQAEEIAGLKIKNNGYSDKVAKYDLTLIAVESEGKLLLTFEYCTRLFKETTIKRFVHYFKTVASAVIKKPDIVLKDIEIFHDFMHLESKVSQMDLDF
ncbi:MAG: amino acid adenylation domain-containing protein [Candidatus Aminicenantes bacterium]|jgi:amino acid adenylation domain-containing protein